MRLCKLHDKDAVFHKWSQRGYTIGESMTYGGPSAGQVLYPVGIVEYKDGTVEEVYPSSIKFTDHFDVGDPWDFNFRTAKEDK